MRKILLSAIACLSFAKAIQAQANKSIFLELAGNGLAFSANFDSRLTKSEKGFGFRVGVGIIPGYMEPNATTIPIGINHLAGKSPNYFESGLGVTYGYKEDGFDYIGYSNGPYRKRVFLIVPSIGYRRAKTGKSFQFRFCITPVIGDKLNLWAGLSGGLRF